MSFVNTLKLRMQEYLTKLIVIDGILNSFTLRKLLGLKDAKREIEVDASSMGSDISRKVSIFSVGSLKL